MNFGLTPEDGRPKLAKLATLPPEPSRSAREIALYKMPETQLAAPRVEGPGRIQKHQLICRKCNKPVEKTEQFKEHSGRTVINCAYTCHGETGVIRVCEDQWGWDTRMLVLQGLPELCDKDGKPLAITDGKPEAIPEKPKAKPGVIDIEAEIVTDDLPPMRRLN